MVQKAVRLRSRWRSAMWFNRVSSFWTSPTQHSTHSIHAITLDYTRLDLAAVASSTATWFARALCYGPPNERAIANVFQKCNSRPHAENAYMNTFASHTHTHLNTLPYTRMCNSTLYYVRCALGAFSFPCKWRMVWVPSPDFGQSDYALCSSRSSATSDPWVLSRNARSVCGFPKCQLAVRRRAVFAFLMWTN